MTRFDLKEIERRMRGALGVLKQEFGGLRTGRANAGLLDPITVTAYGNPMPLNQLATINVPKSRLITVQVWDRGQVGAVERAIREVESRAQPRGRGPALAASHSGVEPGAAHRRLPRSPTNTPSRRGWRCATCAATAWSI